MHESMPRSEEKIGELIEHVRVLQKCVDIKTESVTNCLLLGLAICIMDATVAIVLAIRESKE